jgi:formate-dependent nitrite reductase membrane component NrfD
MLQKKDIETVLKINGIGTGATDDEIRAVLLSARYTAEEVNTALVLLHEISKSNQTRADGLHKVFRSDVCLSPAEISELLGIDVQINNYTVMRNRKREMTLMQIFLVVLLAIGFALLGVTITMYMSKVGVFHSSVELTTKH